MKRVLIKLEGIVLMWKYAMDWTSISVIVCKVEFTDCKKCFDHLYKHNKFKCMMCDFKCKNIAETL